MGNEFTSRIVLTSRISFAPEHKAALANLAAAIHDARYPWAQRHGTDPETGMPTTGDTIMLTGHTAVEYARQHGITLNKYDDPTEDAREDISIEEAEELLSIDPDLLWVDVSDEDIARLGLESGEAGDLVMAAICSLYLGESIDIFELTPEEREQVDSMPRAALAQGIAAAIEQGLAEPDN